MPTFNVKKFKDDQLAKGVSEEKINNFLKKKGFSPDKAKETFSTGIPGFLKGAGKEIIGGTVSTARLVEGLGKRFLGAIDPTRTTDEIKEETGFKSLNTATKEGRGVEESLTPRGGAEKAGFNTALVGEIALPFLLGGKTRTGQKVLEKGSKAVGATARGAGRGAGATAKGAGNVLFGGKETRGIVQSFKRPLDVSGFRKGEFTLESIAEKVTEASNTIRKTSKRAFDDVIERLPGNKVSKQNVVKDLKNNVIDSLGLDVRRINKKNLLDAGMSDQEANLVSRLFNRISAHRDWTDKGLIRLRQAIDKGGFYKSGLKSSTDYGTSNKVVAQVRQALNEAAAVAGKADTALKGALDQASSDIRFLEKLGFNVRGSNPQRNVESTANKLKALLNKIDDPLEKQATKDLLAEVFERTGLDVEDLLKSADASRTLTKDIAGIRSPLGTIQQVAGRGAGKAAETLGRFTGQQKGSQLLQAVRSKAGSTPARIPLSPPRGRGAGVLQEEIRRRANSVR